MLRQQAETNLKERAALRTIMESKIKVSLSHFASRLYFMCLPFVNPQGLVDNVVRLMGEGEADSVATQTRMQRELSALQKLVNASIVALKCVLLIFSLPSLMLLCHGRNSDKQAQQVVGAVVKTEATVPVPAPLSRSAPAPAATAASYSDSSAFNTWGSTASVASISSASAASAPCPARPAPVCFRCRQLLDSERVPDARGHPATGHIVLGLRVRGALCCTRSVDRGWRRLCCSGRCQRSVWLPLSRGWRVLVWSGVAECRCRN